MMATVHDEKTLPNDGASTSDERHDSDCGEKNRFM